MSLIVKHVGRSDDTVSQSNGERRADRFTSKRIGLQTALRSGDFIICSCLALADMGLGLGTDSHCNPARR